MENTDKKVHYILIACGVIGIIIILAGSYFIYRMNPAEPVVIDPIQNTDTIEKESPIVFSASSFSAVVSNIDGDTLTVTKEDGSTENYSMSVFAGIYDNRVIDTMKPITFKDIENGMKVQISRTVNESDKTWVISLSVY